MNSFGRAESITDNRTENVRIPGGTTCRLLTLLGALILAATSLQVQSQSQAIVTDQDSLSVANQFGIPQSSAVNQAGAYAFVGEAGSALFFRPAGSSAMQRLLQTDDAMPGITGSRVR